jgi:hypothetical protein
MTRSALLDRATAAGIKLWLDGDQLRWRAQRPPPPELLTAMRDARTELVEALRPSPQAAALLAFMEASQAALAERELNAEEEAERAAIFGLPPPPLAELSSTATSLPVQHQRAPVAKRPLWESGTMEGRTLAMLRTPGVEAVLERDGWLRISLPDGSYAFVRRATAERIGWKA